MQVMSGHYSPETAFVVEDYPYGFKLRCKIRYWLEVNSKGTRFWSQTTNPKRGDIWNKPKSSTYSLVGVMFEYVLDDVIAGRCKSEEVGHIGWTGLSPYDVSKCQDYLDTCRHGMTAEQINLVETLAKGYASLQARKASELPINGACAPWGTD